MEKIGYYLQKKLFNKLESLSWTVKRRFYVADCQGMCIYLHNNLEKTALNLKLPDETYANFPLVKHTHLSWDVNHWVCSDSI